MAGTDPGARGHLSSFVCALFRGVGKWATFASTDVPSIEENSRQADHTMDSFSLGVYHGGEVVADHPGPVS